MVAHAHNVDINIPSDRIVVNILLLPGSNLAASKLGTQSDPKPAVPTVQKNMKLYLWIQDPVRSLLRQCHLRNCNCIPTDWENHALGQYGPRPTLGLDLKATKQLDVLQQLVCFAMRTESICSWVLSIPDGVFVALDKCVPTLSNFLAKERQRQAQQSSNSEPQQIVTVHRQKRKAVAEGSPEWHC